MAGEAILRVRPRRVRLRVVRAKGSGRVRIVDIDTDVLALYLRELKDQGWRVLGKAVLS